MKSQTLNRILNINAFNAVVAEFQLPYEATQIINCSSLYGVAKSLLALKLRETENQIVLLLPDSKSAEEIFVELTLLGYEEDLILVVEFATHTVQEKLTKITRK